MERTRSWGDVNDLKGLLGLTCGLSWALMGVAEA